MPVASPSPSSTNPSSNRRRAREGPGNSASIVSWTLLSRSGGPATVSGRFRRELSCASRTKKGIPRSGRRAGVCDYDGVDRRGINPEPLHGDERGCPTIEEEARFLGAHVDAGVELAPAPEGVAAPQKPDVHAYHNGPF